MRTNTYRLQQLLSLLRKEGPTNEVLKQVVIALADEVILLERELDRIGAIANRADRNARMGMIR